MDEESFEANIIVSNGWCGGLGEAVLQPPDFNSITFYKEMPVFIDSEFVRRYIDALVQKYIEGGGDPAGPMDGIIPRRIQIRGLFRLVKRTRPCPSIKGQSLKTYWTAKIERLDSLEAFEDESSDWFEKMHKKQ